MSKSGRMWDIVIHPCTLLHRSAKSWRWVMHEAYPQQQDKRLLDMGCGSVGVGSLFLCNGWLTDTRGKCVAKQSFSSASPHELVLANIRNVLTQSATLGVFVGQ